MRTTPAIGATVLALWALSSAVPPAHAQQKAWHTNNFRFEMGGLPATKGANGLTNKGQQKAYQFRTTPLWGVRARNRLLPGHVLPKHLGYLNSPVRFLIVLKNCNYRTFSSDQSAV